jgi:predicted PurR-regulated permease PerM
LQKNLSDIVAAGQAYISRIGSWFISFVSWFATFFAQFLLFFTLSVLFSVDKKNVTHFLSNLWWKDKSKVSKLKIEKVYKNLAVWLKARLLLSLYIAITVWITLVIMWWCGLEIPNKLWIAVIAGLLDIIPYIWPIFTGLLLFVVVVLYNSFLAAILVVLILYVFNVVQENILTPVLMKKALWISPVLILISMMLWWVIMWFLWVLLSVPIAVILVIFFWRADIEMNDSSEMVDELKWKAQTAVSKSKKDLFSKKIKGI